MPRMVGFSVRRLACFFIFFVLGVCHSSAASDELLAHSVGSTTASITLTLRQSVVSAIAGNLDVQISRLNPEIGRKNIGIAKSAFDPSLSFFSSLGSDKQIPLNRFSGTKTETFRLGGSLSKKLDSGSNIKLGMENTKTDMNIADNTFNSFGKFVKTDLFLEWNQPLMRGFGEDVNNVNIVIARNNQVLEEYAFEASVLDVALDVHTIYWNLLFYTKQLELNRLLLKKAEALLADNKEKVQIGVMASIEVLQAEVGVSTRQEEIIKSQDKIYEYEDKLKDVLNIAKDSEYWYMSIVPVDKLEIPKVVIDEGKSLRMAFKTSPDLKRQEVLVKNIEKELFFAKNDMLPSLELQAKAALHGLGNDFTESFDRLKSRNFRELTLGVVLNYPMYNREKNNALLKKKLQLIQEKTKRKKLKRSITFSIRNAIRRLRTEVKRIDVSLKTVELEKKQLSMEEEKLKVGISTSHDILDFQSELAVAQTAYLRSVSDYLITLAELRKMEGSLLKEQNIRLGK